MILILLNLLILVNVKDQTIYPVIAMFGQT